MQLEGLVGFSYSPNSFVSRSIRFFRKDWMPDAPSHTFMIAGKIGDELMVIEATDPKARIVPITKLMTDTKRFELWAVNNIEHTDKIRTIKEMMPYVTMDYGYLQLIGFVWVWLWNKFKIKVGNPFKSGITCAEFVFKALAKMPYIDPNLMCMSADDVAPDHILRSFRSNKYCSIVAVYRPEKRLLDWID